MGQTSWSKSASFIGKNEVWMKPKKCRHCGTDFIPRGSKSTCCSISCLLHYKSEATSSGCIEWTGTIGSHGYGVINIGGDVFCVHRLSYVLSNGEPPEDDFVLHKCGNRKCINTIHLYSGSQVDNMRDMVKHGRHWCKGRKLTEEERAKLRVPKKTHRWMRTG